MEGFGGFLFLFFFFISPQPDFVILTSVMAEARRPE